MNWRSVSAVPHARACCLAVGLSIASLAYSQVVAFRQVEFRGDEFGFLGIDYKGVVWIVGEEDNALGPEPALFAFRDGEFEVTPLPPLPGAYFCEPRRISRDGQYIIGVTARNYEDEPTIWTRSEPNAPRSMGYFIEREWTLPTAVASTVEGPVVVGAYDFGSFIWTETTGYRAWMTNGGFWQRRYVLSITADAAKWAGYEITDLRPGGAILPFVGTETDLKILDAEGSLQSRAQDISPNGLYACGTIDAQGAIWTKDKVWIPGSGTSFHFFSAVTDSGYAGGRGSMGGIIFDPHGRKVHLFDEWWAKHYPATPLPGHVTGVEDLYEYNGDLYCLVSAFDGTQEDHLGVLAIAPLNGGGKASRTQR